jgi:hypothetical protein
MMRMMGWKNLAVSSRNSLAVETYVDPRFGPVTPNARAAGL